MIIFYLFFVFSRNSYDNEFELLIMKEEEFPIDLAMLMSIIMKVP